MKILVIAYDKHIQVNKTNLPILFVKFLHRTGSTSMVHLDVQSTLSHFFLMCVSCEEKMRERLPMSIKIPFWCTVYPGARANLTLAIFYYLFKSDLCSCKQFEWKMPFGNASIKKWVKEMKEKRKEGKRLQRAEVHAALSIAGLATALAAIAEESSKGQLEYESCPARRAALASAAAVVASQCAQVAESIGAKKDQLSSIIGSAMNGTTTNDIFTLTAAATTCTYCIYIINFL